MKNASWLATTVRENDTLSFVIPSEAEGSAVSRTRRKREILCSNKSPNGIEPKERTTSALKKIRKNLAIAR
jgi:hypothetical protein